MPFSKAKCLPAECKYQKTTNHWITSKVVSSIKYTMFIFLVFIISPENWLLLEKNKQLKRWWSHLVFVLLCMSYHIYSISTFFKVVKIGHIFHHLSPSEPILVTKHYLPVHKIPIKMSKMCEDILNATSYPSIHSGLIILIVLACHSDNVWRLIRVFFRKIE